MTDIEISNSTELADLIKGMADMKMPVRYISRENGFVAICKESDTEVSICVIIGPLGTLSKEPISNPKIPYQLSAVYPFTLKCQN